MYFHYEHLYHIISIRQHHERTAPNLFFFMKGSPKPLTPKKLSKLKDRSRKEPLPRLFSHVQGV